MRKERMKTKNVLILAVCFPLAGLFSSCDDGRIYEEQIVIPQEGLSLKMTGNISNIGDWPSGYSLVVAGFNEGSEYAVVSKIVPNPSADGGKVEVEMSGITDEVTRVEFCVTDRLRRRVHTFHKMDVADAVDGVVVMDVGQQDVGMYGVVQDEVFTPSCATCHGASAGGAAAGLYLTEGRSYAALVDQPAACDPGMLRVCPGDAGNSFLYLVLSRDGDTGHPHTDILDAKRKTVLLNLIEDWIDKGAQP